MYLLALRSILYDEIEHRLDPHMGGIRKGDIAAAWVARTNTIICKAQEWGLSAIVVSVDIARAFATVDHPFLLQACFHLGVDINWIRLLHSELSNTSISMRYHGRKVEVFVCVGDSWKGSPHLLYYWVFVLRSFGRLFVLQTSFRLII